MPKLNFSLTQLEYVLAVYRYGHFAKAAEACFVTQPTLSMQIQKLEESLGITIFDRSKKPILLTDTGKELVETMQAVLEESKKIESIIQSRAHGVLEGELSVGIIPTLAPYLLPPLLPILERQFPALQIKVQELQTSRIIEALHSDEIDVGILAIPLKIPKIIETALYYEPFSILCKKGHEIGKQKKIEYADLKFDDIWLLEEGHCLRHQVLDVCSIKQKKGIKKRVQFESGSLETLKNMVNMVGGYTLLPYMATEGRGSNTMLVEFERPTPSRQIGLVRRREHHKSELIKALGESILSAIPEELRQLQQKNLDVLKVE